ncbi:TonB-dependent receptor [Sphingomonas sp.]|uniref:TonB-dependent receptor n=1 Tax=Sphingomonas sp. TaxID=28214 RepID=UPI002C9F6A87|nr:TonB-dependent receptor [Sphingomonas sp.]HWK35437.1 TonB-dependent receptor [Sphingomonas sp.]
MKIKALLLATLPVWAMASTGAAAQTAPDAASAATGDAQQADSQSGGLADIVVTAQRRAQNLQDVPIAVTAVTSDGLLSQGIGDTRELAQSVPGLQVTTQLGNVITYLRGVGTAATSTESPVAIYLDGVYLASQGAGLTQLDNIERVEVLKGPQGTLFGRNTTGGVIQFVTRDPRQQFEGSASASYGNFNTVALSGYVSGGLATDLAANLAVSYRDQADGWGRNLTLGTDIFTSKSFAIRGKMLWTPGDTRITLSGDYSYVRSDQGMGLHFAPGYYGLDGTTTYGGYYDSYGNFAEEYRNKQYGAMLKIEHDFGPLQLVSISSYRKAPMVNYYDQDGTPAGIVNAGPLRLKSRTISQELQVLSPGGSKIQWIAGLFFYDDQYGADPYQIGPAGGFPYRLHYSDVPTRSYAAFAQTTFAVLPQTNLTLGLRYTIDEKSVDGRILTPTGAVALSRVAELNSDRLTWRVALDHHFNDDVLGYISYNRGFKSGIFSVANFSGALPESVDAYEAGLKTELANRAVRLNLAGFYYDYTNIQLSRVTNGAQTVTNAGAAEIYGAEAEIDAVLGRNLTLRGSMAWVHGRYSSYPDAPYFLPNPVTTVPAGITCPATRPTTRGGNLSCSGDATGNQIIRTPPLSINVSGTYKIPTSIGDFSLSGSYAYNGNFYWTPDNTIHQPAYHLFGGTVGWQPANQAYRVEVWARNIGNARYAIYGDSGSLGRVESPGEPRTYGVTLSTKF